MDIYPDPSQIGTWGPDFGGLVAHRHGERRENFPALRPAIQRHGDDFYSRLRNARETDRKQALLRAQSAHYQKFESEYLDYLRAELARNEAENTKLFQALVLEEAEKLNVLRTNRFGLNVERLAEQYQSGRLERFQQMLIFEEGHGGAPLARRKGSRAESSSVIIGDAEEERLRRAKSLISNIQREDLSALEVSQTLQDMKDDNPDVKTNRDLAALIGKTEQWVEKLRTPERIIPYDSVVRVIGIRTLS